MLCLQQKVQGVCELFPLGFSLFSGTGVTGALSAADGEGLSGMGQREVAAAVARLSGRPH